MFFISVLGSRETLLKAREPYTWFFSCVNYTGVCYSRHKEMLSEQSHQ